MARNRNQGSNSRSNRNSGGGRGLASADQATRERVARMGGQASHGGGRRRKDNDMF